MTLTSDQQKKVEENLGLVHSCAARFKGRGAEYEDLFQAGCVGLIKAVGGFDESLGYQFSTYAVPAILGEIKRVFRDGGSVKIGRAAKEKAVGLLKIMETLTEEAGREPTVGEIALRAGLHVSETAVLLSACLPTVSLTNEENSESDVPVPPPEESLIGRLDLFSAMERLSDGDRRLLEQRYFKNQTQSAVAKTLGMTQVQVSRREKQILLRLRKMLE